MSQDKNYTPAEIEQIVRENKTLKQANRSLRQQVSSRRFKAADRAADVFNSVLPPDTNRRKAFGKVWGGVRKVSHFRANQRYKYVKTEASKLFKAESKLIVMNAIEWDAKLQQRPQHLAQEFQKLGYFVVYLELSNYAHDYRQISDNLVTINSLNYLPIFTAAKTKYFMQPSTTCSPNIIELEEIKELGFDIIFDYIDEFDEAISPNAAALIETWNGLEQLNPIVIVTTAQKLYEHATSRFSASKIVMAKNAVDTNLFSYQNYINPAIPDDLKQTVAQARPIVGYYGAIAPWLDYQLLNSLAEARADLEFVYIGMNYGNALSKLELLPNVHFLGIKDYADLPKYSYWFNCAIVPFEQGDIAKCTSPVKVFEYMAMGLPTVCTRDLDECKGYDYVYMSANAAEFARNIDQAIADKQDDQKRQRLLAYAQQNTWAQRAKAIVERLN